MEGCADTALRGDCGQDHCRKPGATAQEVAKLLTAKGLRELSLDLIDAAINSITANTGIIITNGVRRVGLHTLDDKAWEPMWTNLERTNSLWQSISRNDVVVREGRVLDPANNPVPTAAELAEKDEEIAAGMDLGADL